MARPAELRRHREEKEGGAPPEAHGGGALAIQPREEAPPSEMPLPVKAIKLGHVVKNLPNALQELKL